MMLEKTELKADNVLKIREDNNAFILLFKNIGKHKPNKHIDYRRFFVLNVVNDGNVLLHMSSIKPTELIFLRSLWCSTLHFPARSLCIIRHTKA